MQAVNFTLAFCGFGPASSGLLFSLAKSGDIAKVGRQGIMIVERSKIIGSGKLSKYKMQSNTLSDVILECVCDNLLPEEMTELRQQSQAVSQLEVLRGQAPDLSLVSNCLMDASEMLVSSLSKHHHILLQREHFVEALTVRDDGTFDVEVRAPTGNLITSRVASVVLNLGGIQTSESRASLGSVFHCTLPKSMPIIPSDSVLRKSDAGLLAQFSPLLGKRRTLVVAGSSHSAFSVVERLAKISDRAGFTRIILYYRSEPRFYYHDLTTAELFGEHIDASRDVCPLSGKVNRLGGLRFRTAEVAREVFKTKRLEKYPVEIEFKTAVNRSGEAVLADELRDVAAIVTCYGYRPLLPILRDQTGDVLKLAEDDHGLTTDEFGRPLTQDNNVIRGLFSFGLGSGMRVGSEVGGEPSYKRRLDGIWLYHNHVGKKVVTGMIHDLQQLEIMSRASCRSWAAGDDPPSLKVSEL